MQKAKTVTAAVFGVGLLALAALTFAEARAAHLSPSEYHFGSEAMLFHGGWIYQSQASYVRTTLLEGSLFLAAGGASVAFVFLKRWPYAAIALIAALVGIGVHLSAIVPAA
ncbi:MAG: hypothetical protein WBX15_12230 [Thermoanaerobaculia bacterium]